MNLVQHINIRMTLMAGTQITIIPTTMVLPKSDVKKKKNITSDHVILLSIRTEQFGRYLGMGGLSGSSHRLLTTRLRTLTLSCLL